jgi:Trypsin-like peptidase domain
VAAVLRFGGAQTYRLRGTVAEIKKNAPRLRYRDYCVFGKNSPSRKKVSKRPAAFHIWLMQLAQGARRLRPWQDGHESPYFACKQRKIVDMIPNVEAGAIKAYLESVVLPMVIIGPDGIPQPVGTASIVATIERQLLILTARHNIDHVKNVDQPYGDGAHPSMPDIFRAEPSKDHFIKNTYCYLVFPSREGNKYSPIRSVAYKPDFDIALCYCVLPDGIELPAPLAIDTDPPHVGMKGCAIGYVDMSARIIQPDERQSDVLWEFEGQFSMSDCEVIGAEPRGSSLCRSPCFQINVPIHSGMSGGPVINFPDDKNPAICGILTSDLSTNPDALTEASGENALASALGISVALSMWIDRSNGAKEERTLLDLVKGGVIKNFGTVDYELMPAKNGRIEVIPKLGRA